MKSAAKSFYLAVFALLGSAHGEAPRSNAQGPDTCAIEPKAIVSDACASYLTLDSINTALTPSLKELTETTDFFAYYRLNLFNKVCPFWSDATGMCGNIACAVNTLDNEEDIPQIWRAEELGKLQGPKAGHPGRKEKQERAAEKPLQGELGEDVGESCVLDTDDECDDRDYCIPEDESADGDGDYVSLVDNPERFTGYTGPSARQIWDAIYRENCFSGPKSESSTPGSSSFGSQASSDLRVVMKGHERQQALSRLAEKPADSVAPSEDSGDFDDACLEKRVFYRVISGMHASISTHLCWDYLNQTTGTWGPNLACYEERLHKHPERISNLYFNYALVLRAVTKLRRHMQDYTFCSGDVEQDRMTKRKALATVDKAVSLGGLRIFDETLMFTDESDFGLKEDFKSRFRNVSRLMDCVGCDKCRLWGKLQTAGYGAALKVLFEYDESAGKAENPPLRRTELVALVNTLEKISSALAEIEEMRIMLAQASLDQDLRDAEDDPDPPHPPRSPAREEWDRVWGVFRFVVMGWFKMPSIIWKIILSELIRVWEYWLGLPVRPRAWEFTSFASNVAAPRPVMHVEL